MVYRFCDNKQSDYSQNFLMIIACMFFNVCLNAIQKTADFTCLIVARSYHQEADQD
jgi:hypothetical protein